MPTSVHEVQFPPTIAEGAVYGPGFKTTIISTGGGFEFRNIEWDRDRSQGDVGTGIKSREDFQEILAFFRARHGPGFGFRFKDWADFELDLETIIADATAGQTTGQLTKAYADSAATYVRTIFKPVAGTIQLFKNGSLTPMTGVTVNTVTGALTFPALSAHDVVRASGEFDNCVRFLNDDLRLQLQKFDIGEVPSIPIIELKLDSDGQG